MALSKDTLKNLIDAMQKVSLAITAVSIALFSNVALSHKSVEKEAVDELAQFLRIRDLTMEPVSKYDLNVGAVIAEPLGPFGRDGNLKLKIGSDGAILGNVTFPLPLVLQYCSP
jgi:hypothetical protein